MPSNEPPWGLGEQEQGLSELEHIEHSGASEQELSRLKNTSPLLVLYIVVGMVLLLLLIVVVLMFLPT